MDDLSKILDPLDRVIWGAYAFGLVINKSEDATNHMLQAGLLDADKCGGRWNSTPRRLINSLSAQDK